MIFRTIVGLLIMLIVCSCIQQPSNSGLRIDNGPNRGLTYTDTLGNKHNYRYITTTITNDSTIRIHLQIAFSNEYDYPAAYGDQKLKVFLLPPDKVTLVDSMSHELRNFFERGLDTPHILSKMLEPGEKYVVTIGTLYKYGGPGAVPNELFLQDIGEQLPSCDNLKNQDKSTYNQLTLWLKLSHSKILGSRQCSIIPCGQISYPKD